MFSLKDNDCVGFDSKWKVKRVFHEGDSQTDDPALVEISTSTAETSEIETQTDNVQKVGETSESDMEKLAEWLSKIYPNVDKELNEATNSKAFYGTYNFEESDVSPEAKLLQTLKVFEGGKGEAALRVNALSWNSTGNSLAVSCNFSHTSWCHHSGQVNIYTFDRNDKLQDTPSKKLAASSCISVLRFHPSVPSIIACGSHSGEIIIWNIQHDDGDEIVSKVSGHEELVTEMLWMHDINTSKSLLLATSSLDGHLILWNFSLLSSSLTMKQIYKIKSPVLARVPMSKTFKPNPEKVVREILSFDFSIYVPDLFIVGTDGGLVVQCSMLGASPLKGSTTNLSIADPVFKYYECHEGEIQTVKCSPNRRDMFLTCATDGEIRVYVIGQELPARVIFVDKQLSHITWIPYQEKLVVGCGAKGIMEIFHLINNRALENITSEKIVPTLLLHVEVNKQRCTTVAVGNDRGELQLWSVPWSLFAMQKLET